MQKRCSYNLPLAYSELVEYDANTNITSLQRYGMKNDKSFGLIDDLSIDHNGNQITSVSDAVDENLNYEGAFDFADGDDKNKEYAYNGNGALTMDLNRGIDKIEYDLLGNPQMITLSGGRTIEYVYSADGRRLRTKHTQKISIGGLPLRGKTNPVLHRIFSDSTDYIGNFILKNGKPQMYLFAGGYYSFDGENTPECHYYIADYQGNNRMVVSARTNEVEQTTHYYPYGGIIGNLSSNQDAQKYKYSGKELDRTYGLDLYDFHARLFNPALPVFDRPDPLAWDYACLSPYNYCAGDPVNLVDPTGMSYKTDSLGHITYEDDDYKKTRLEAYDGSTTKINEGQADVLDGLINSQEKGETDSNGNQVAYTQTTKAGRRSMLSLFRFLAKHTIVEWGLTSFYSNGVAPASYSLATSHQRSTCVVPYVNQWDRVRFNIQSHPRPGGQPSAADISIAHTMVRVGCFQPLFGIYEASVDRFLRYVNTKAPQDYDANSPRIDVSTLDDLINIFNPLFK